MVRVLLLLALLTLPRQAWPTEGSPPACLERLAEFAAEQDLAFDPARVTFGERWAGAGHEIRRLPGFTARIPVARCGAALAVHLNPDCRIVMSRGEGSCKRDFPPTFR